MKVYDTHLVSDSGHTCLIIIDGVVSAMQHSIVETWLTEEDKRMVAMPLTVWTEFKGVW